MKSIRHSLPRSPIVKRLDLAFLRFAFWWSTPPIKKLRWYLFFAVAILVAVAFFAHVLLFHTWPPLILLLGGPIWYAAGIAMFWIETPRADR